MILCDTEIRSAIRYGQIIVEPPPDDEQYSTTAVDLRLGGSEFKRWHKHGPGIDLIIDPSQKGFFPSAASFLVDCPTGEDGSLILKPGDFVLALTLERIEIREESRLAARVEGKSSLARLGLGIHVTAPTIHAGFQGQITLEMKNHGDVPIRLRPGMPVCQLIFELVFGTPTQTMAGLFHDQVSVKGKA